MRLHLFLLALACVLLQFQHYAQARGGDLGEEDNDLQDHIEELGDETFSDENLIDLDSDDEYYDVETFDELRKDPGFDLGDSDESLEIEPSAFALNDDEYDKGFDYGDEDKLTVGPLKTTESS